MDALPPSAHAEPPLPSAPERETGESHVHVVPLRVLVAVWLTLLVLTVMTGLMDLSRGNLLGLAPWLGAAKELLRAACRVECAYPEGMA